MTMMMTSCDGRWRTDLIPIMYNSYFDSQPRHGSGSREILWTPAYLVNVPTTWGRIPNLASPSGCARSIFSHGPASLNDFPVDRQMRHDPMTCDHTRPVTPLV